VGRVHRIGQSKQTFVYRFFIQGTVESKIYKHVYQKVHPRHIKRPTTRPLTVTYIVIRQRPGHHRSPQRQHNLRAAAEAVPSNQTLTRWRWRTMTERPRQRLRLRLG